MHLGQTSVASLLGVSRQAVNEALADLRNDGIAETGYRRMRVLDRSRLCTIAGSPAQVC